VGLVVDTSAVVDLERADRTLAEALDDLAREPTGLPAIVLAELLVGAQLASAAAAASRRRGKLESIRARVPVIDFTAAAAERWAELRVELTRAGTPIPSNDLCVAATALVLDWDVLVGHRDEAHFRRVPGLGVRTLPTP
jgi:tRNA(fMet)-specific endonuclease VapC